MGEYALYKKQEIKIGTCEDLYYLRASQADKVRALDGNVDPVRDRYSLRFRFPWPDEDDVEPGADGFHAHGFDRSIGISKVQAPADVDHGSIQFKADPGYLISLPCPEDPKTKILNAADMTGLTIHRNGFSGAVHIVQQKWLAGPDPNGDRLVLICRCGGCGERYRVERYEDALPIVEECRARGVRDDSSWWAKVADRIEAGYRGEVLA